MAIIVIHATLIKEDPQFLDRIKNVLEYAQEIFTSRDGHKTLRIKSDDVPEDDIRVWPIMYSFEGINHPVIIGFE